LRSLTPKLILAFLIVSLAGASLAAAFARWATYREFDRLVLDQTEANFVADLAAFYEANGSWKDVAASLSPGRGPAPQPNSRMQVGEPPPPGAQPQPARSDPFVLVDRDRTVVIAAGGYQVGDRVPMGVFSREAPVEAGGRVVGTVLATGRPIALDPKEQQYLARTTLR
jgi:hypothetical protein